MAKDVKVISLCDPCDQQNFSGMEAVATHVLVMDGGPPREVDMCARDEAFFLRVYNSGRDIPIEPPKAAPVKEPKAKAVKAVKPKELEVSADKEAPKAKLRIRCPLDHPSEGGGKRDISYTDRASHVGQCHPELKPWEIEWEDPDKILVAFCTTHDFCKRYGFTTQRGVSQHINALRKNPPTGQEGDPQKSDGPSTV